MARKRRGLKDNAAAYTPRAKQAPSPKVSGGLGGLADKVKQAATLVQKSKQPTLRSVIKGRPAKHKTSAGMRRLSAEEAIARRTTESSKARAAARYGVPYKPQTQATTPSPAGSKPVPMPQKRADLPGEPRATVNFHKRSKKSFRGRRFDSRV
jgi:hypothetical protein